MREGALMGGFRGMALVSAAIFAAACTTSGARPDLIVSRLEATPPAASAGSSITIASAIRNAGAAPAREPAAIDIFLFEDGEPAGPAAYLTGWRPPDGAPLDPGQTVEDSAQVRLPGGLKPARHSICGVVDPEDRIAESFEDNNRTCIPLEIVAGPPALADLVIEKVTPLAYEQASLKVKIKIRNAGAAPAETFRIMAFRRSPRLPLLLIECPLTEGQLSAGSPASCPDLTQRAPLLPGASAELTGYFNYVVANGAQFVRQPVTPDYKKPLVSRSVDFMIDGCFPPEDGAPVHCAVDEIDEINNFKGATLSVR